MTTSTKIGIAIALLVIGITIMATGRIHTGMSKSFDEERYVIGAAHVLIGVFFFIWGYQGRTKGESFLTDDVFLICPKCGEPYSSLDVKNDTCPTCNVDLEPVEGFYSRHPEFKDEDNEARQKGAHSTKWGWFCWHTNVYCNWWGIGAIAGAAGHRIAIGSAAAAVGNSANVSSAINRGDRFGSLGGSLSGLGLSGVANGLGSSGK